LDAERHAVEHAVLVRVVVVVGYICF
jgi:hypothetical protein